MITRIGVCDTSKELELDMDDGMLESLKADFEAVISAATGVLWMTDRHGRQVGIPAERIAYIDLDEPGSGPKIGFGA